ncbi:MAG: cytochrome c-type biogenesis protein CcmH [Deltaproteobacteria bacterium]|jgi:cytochrome c-type biogenesis protein CcmH|nr:cytochrome c-type biogenesis protein CcmH [Deltaproteobacteria bacterium]
MLHLPLLLLLAVTPDEAATELEERLLAPCCWNQTLDIHASPLASSIRSEIRRRLESGETVAQVESDLVARHGERIRAVPHAGFMRPIGIGLLAFAGIAFVGVVAFGRRRAKVPAPPPPPVIAADDRKALDQALLDLDG